MKKLVADVDRLKLEVLPALFSEPARIGEYGANGDSRANMEALSRLMEGGSVGSLAGTIAKILNKMTDASPERIAKKPGWVARTFGGELETRARYHVARKTFDTLLAEAEGQAQGVRDTVNAIDQLIDAHRSEVEYLTRHIQAAREFLIENPGVGVAAGGALEFDRPRERLARKVANLATLLASHELGVSQMKLSKAQAVDLLDRFSETVSVLVPVWRQHTLTLITTKAINPALVAEASTAHKALMQSLSSSLKDIQH